MTEQFRYCETCHFFWLSMLKIKKKNLNFSQRNITKNISVFVQAIIFFVYSVQIMLSVQVQFTLFENKVPVKTEQRFRFAIKKKSKKHSVVRNL